MISSLTLINWFSLIFSILIFTGPGFLFLSFYKGKKSLDFIGQFVFSLISSLAIWVILLLVFYFFPYKIDKSITFIFFYGGWIIFLIKEKIWSFSIKINGFRNINYGKLIFLFLAFLSLIVFLFSIRSTTVGLGSDSYHHTLIAQLILDQGKVPNSYLPYAPLISFSYHFGFHSFVAAITWLSNIPVRLMVPILGCFLIIFSSLSIYALARELFKNELIGEISGLISIFVSVFPYYMLNWGRFPQLLGLSILPMLFVVFILWKNENFNNRHIIQLSLLAFILGISHYRVTIIAIIGLISYLLFDFGSRPVTINQILFIIKNSTFASFVTLIFYSPWIIIVYASRLNSIGHSIKIQKSSDFFYSLERLGKDVIHYPTNFILISVLIFCLMICCYKKDRFVYWLIFFSITLYILSGRDFLSQYMDTISVIISLYIPFSIIIGRGLVYYLDKFAFNFVKKLFLLISLIVIVFGLIQIPKFLTSKNSYVTTSDLEAIEWVENNTPPDSLFLVNTVNFDFNPDFIISVDAGYWLPLLGHRQTITLPMIFSMEKHIDKKYFKILKTIHNLNSDFTSPTSIELLRNSGVTHFFVGELSDEKNVQQIMNSNEYQIIYKNSKSYVFKLAK